MEHSEAHVGKIAAQLQEWGVELDALMLQAKQAGAEAKAEYRTRIDEMESQLEQWGAKLEQLVAEMKEVGAEAKTALREKHRAAKELLDELKAVAAKKWEGPKPAVVTGGNDPAGDAALRQTEVAQLEAQLKAWAMQLDALVVGLSTHGAAHDGYHARIDGLRARLAVVQAKLGEFTSPSGPHWSWADFAATVVEDRAALETGFKDLTH